MNIPDHRKAIDKLDAHVREVVEWHFNPETGTPFWLEFAKSLDWDPRREIQSYEDLDRFGPTLVVAQRNRGGDRVLVWSE